MLNLNWINQKNLPHLNIRVHFSMMMMMRLAYSMMKTTTSGKKKIRTMMKLLL
jgi:hypothetical protein